MTGAVHGQPQEPSSRIISLNGASNAGNRSPNLGNACARRLLGRAAPQRCPEVVANAFGARRTAR